MAFIRPVMLGVMSTLARALASGVGLLAAQSLKRGLELAGRGAPAAVSGFRFFSLIYYNIPHNRPLVKRQCGTRSGLPGVTR